GFESILSTTIRASPSFNAILPASKDMRRMCGVVAARNGRPQHSSNTREMNLMQRRPKRIVPGLAVLVAAAGLASATSAQDGIDRTVLPVPEPQPPAFTQLDARDAKAPPRFEVRAPRGAPNVVIVLLDDIGFGQSSAFGGPARMATLDR